MSVCLHRAVCVWFWISVKQMCFYWFLWLLLWCT